MNDLSHVARNIINRDSIQVLEAEDYIHAFYNRNHKSSSKRTRNLLSTMTIVAILP